MAYIEDEVARAAVGGITLEFRVGFRRDVFGRQRFKTLTVDEECPHTAKLVGTPRRDPGSLTIAYFSSIGDSTPSSDSTRHHRLRPDGENTIPRTSSFTIDTVVQTSETIYGFLESLLL
jgi:hypothetical protein